MTTYLLEPHPDDAALFAAFTAIQYQATVITVLRPDRMDTDTYPGGRVRLPVRLAEHVSAMSELGLDWTVWDFSDLAPAVDAIADQIVSLECDLLIAPAVEEDGHEDHNLVGSLALAHGCEVAQYLTYTRSGGRSTSGNEVEFDPSWVPRKLRALACYESQIAHPATGSWWLDGIREWVA